MARRTEAHLMDGGRGNFGPFGIMDWIHSTAIGGSDVMDDVQKEVEKRDVKGKAKGAAHRASDAAGELLEDGDDNSDEDGVDDGGVASRARNQVTRALRGRKTK